MYKLLKKLDGTVFGAVKETEGFATSFTFDDEENSAYQEYQKWVAEGNEPLPADE